ncbi:nucleoporin Nup43-like isoform X4 [Amphibalanus amphitrite]|uniref:nucleoporin Nup43-like isoform X4 n=1 Tax=Amphibalanus amphitrite TaxID=1232801 RepID=UPI001C916E81|nr:nucleoporin Nup43-like isoform X4 [Amphibalanus amphitrite]XP_043247262.1 nucleoporin Nup43-like isoform X4 [Amphibalanus amphitrite]
MMRRTVCSCGSGLTLGTIRAACTGSPADQTSTVCLMSRWTCLRRPPRTVTSRSTVTCPSDWSRAGAGTDFTAQSQSNSHFTGRRWDRLHRTKRGAAPCTWLSAFEQELVSVGDDGRMVVLNMHSQKPGRVIAADTCSVYRVQHVTHSHVVTANMRGQLKSWDLRADSDEPTSSVMASQQQCAVTALARHPTQYHVLASGDGDGVICIWDMRQPRFPVTELKSHADEVSDLLFHRLCPDSLFSAAHDGSVCQWNIGTTASSGLSARLHTSGREPPADAAQTSWLTLDASKRYLDVLSLLPAGPLPVNSLDVSEDRLVCGGDNEVIHCVSQLTV